MKVSIIIPTKNRINMLNECINSIENQSRKPEEIIIIGDVSDILTNEFIKNLKSNMNIIYLSMTGGTCKKRNQGIKQSNGDVLLFMDDDAILQRDYIKHLISAFINENIHVMTGYIFDSIDLISPPLKRKGEIDYLLKNVDDDFVKLVTEKVFMYASLSYTNKDFIMRQLRYFIKCIFLLESHAKGKILRSGYRSEMPDLNHINGLVEVEFDDSEKALRKLSIPELKVISSFPSDYILTGTYSKQWERIGRAVPPLMMKAIAEHVWETILKPNK